MTKTIKQAVADHRQRKNDLAAQICMDHDLPTMTWEGMGTWAMKYGIVINLLYCDNDAVSRVDGNNYARRKDGTK